MTEAWTVYLCHACGWMQSDEQSDLACANCGESRSMVEAVEVTRVDELEKAIEAGKHRAWAVERENFRCGNCIDILDALSPSGAS